MADVLIALGGNLGDVQASFDRAIPLICERAGGTLTARSANYRTPPWGDEDQPAFINACIRMDTSLQPHELLAELQAVERAFGRDRVNERRWGPRRLDLDLLAYDELTLATPDLTLPHPRLFGRAFVLVPLAEIAPDRQIAGRTAAECLAHVAAEGIVRLPR
jgi:2-amino-4-hydroxy-6-hydroxymethyldihydropteridine diphosphokinase